MQTYIDGLDAHHVWTGGETVGALLPCTHNHGITYRSTVPTLGRVTVVAALRAGAHAGTLCATGHGPGHHHRSGIHLELLTTSGTVWHRLCIPSRAAFTWWATTFKFQALSTACRTCHPTLGRLDDAGRVDLGVVDDHVGEGARVDLSEVDLLG